MRTQRITVTRFPEKIPENELNADLFEFYENTTYVGWLTRESVRKSPLELILTSRYYLVGREFLEPPTFRHKPECDHDEYGWIWDNDKLAWDCCHCRILINDPYMREMHESGYYAWRRH